MAIPQAPHLFAGEKPLDGVSVIIVTYNAARYLQTCLDSIYSQRYPAVEVIVIDGQSNDGTQEILQANNSKIHFWLSEKDNGIYDAMNKAIPHITRRWVYFSGADDELLPAFSTMVEQAVVDHAIYYGNVLVDGITKSGLIAPYYMAKGGIYHQAILYPKSVFENYSYDTKYPIAADYALNMQLYSDNRYKFDYAGITIAKYNPTGISSKVIDTAFEKDKLKLILTNFGVKIGFRYLFRVLKASLRGRKY